MDTYSQLARQHREAEAAERQRSMEAAQRVINRYCAEAGWPEEDRLEVLAALGLAEPHTQG